MYSILCLAHKAVATEGAQKTVGSARSAHSERAPSFGTPCHEFVIKAIVACRGNDAVARCDRTFTHTPSSSNKGHTAMFQRSRLSILSIVLLASYTTSSCVSERAEGRHSRHERGTDERSRESTEHEQEAEGDADEEQEVAWKDTPKAVQEAFARVAGSNSATRVTREEDNDVLVFELEFQKDGHTCSVKATAGGDLLEVEQGIAPGAVPSSILKSILRQYPGAAISTAEQVQEFHYSVVVVRNGEKRSVDVSPTGEVDDEDRDH